MLRELGEFTGYNADLKPEVEGLKCEVVDVSSCSECRLHGRFDPSVWRGGVFPCKVDPALALEQFSRIVPLLVGGEECEGAQAVRIQAPLLHQPACAERPDSLTVDLHQVLQNHGHQLVVGHSLEEGGVIGAGVGGQQGASIGPGEGVTGVVDEAGGPVGDALPPSDALLLPETLAEAEHHLGGAGVVNRAQRLHFVPGQRGLEVDEEGGLGGGRDQHVVHRQRA